MTTSATADAASGDAPLTRRERQRLATHDEIVGTARGLLRTGEEISIRAVAHAMGLTPPALYRYVDSLATLADAVTQAVLADVVGLMAAARDRQPAEDPAAQIVAASVAFRGWALRNPREYQAVFGTPPEPEAACAKQERMLRLFEPPDGAPIGAEAFGRFFSEIFARLWEQRPFAVAAPEEIDPSFVAMYDAESRALLESVLGERALGVLWTFEMAWVRLYGVVTLEVFGHIYADLVASGAVFDAQLVDIGRTIGLEGDWERLRTVAQSERVLAAG